MGDTVLGEKSYYHRLQKTSCNTLFSIGSQHIQTASMSAVAQDENKIEMSNHEKFLFDLNGFIVLRNVLNEEEVQQLNDAIDANIHKAVSRETAGLKNAEGFKIISGGQ